MRRVFAALVGGIVGAGVSVGVYEIAFRAMLVYEAVQERDLQDWGRLAGLVLGFGFGAAGAWFRQKLRCRDDWLAAASLFLLAFGIAVGQHYWRSQPWPRTWAKALQVPAALCAGLAGITIGTLVERPRRGQELPGQTAEPFDGRIGQ